MIKFKNYIKENISKIEYIKKIKADPFGAMSDMSNIGIPPKKYQLIAVKSDGHSIRYIKNPDKEVQLAAVKQNGYAVKHIKNPEENIQIAAVIQNPFSVQDILWPTIKTQTIAFKNEKKKKKPRIEKIIKLLPNIGNSSDLQYKLLKIDYSIFLYFPNITSQKVQEFVISKHPSFLSQYPNKFGSFIKKKYKYLITPGKLGILDNND